jgi:hypothetical protein
MSIFKIFKGDSDKPKQPGFMSKLLSTSNEISSLRFGMLLWVVGTWLIWAIVSLYKMEIQPLAVELSMIIGALSAAKATQSFAEVKNLALMVASGDSKENILKKIDEIAAQDPNSVEQVDTSSDKKDKDKSKPGTAKKPNFKKEGDITPG